MLKNRKITLFKIKSKEEKAIEKIRKKKVQIEKLKEEIIKMGRLVLKDGKLEKVETPQQSQQESVREMPPPPIDIEYVKPQIQVQEPQEIEPPMFRGRPPEYREPSNFRPRVQQQYQPPEDLTVDIILVEGQTVQVKVSMDNAQNLLDAIGGSIETGTVLVVGNKAINPKHIIMYQYG